jgi:hypothetical protein
MLTVIKDSSGHHVEVARFNDIYKKRMKEIRANSGMYMGSISSTLRKLPSSVQCELIDLARNSIKGMGAIESDLVGEYPIERCLTALPTNKKDKPGVR